MINRLKILEIENSNLHEDVSFKLFTCGEDDKKEQVELVFVTNPSRIYRTSDYKKVLYPPREIPIRLNIKNLCTFVGALINSVSPVLSQHELLKDIDNTFVDDNGITVCLRVPKNSEKDKIVIDMFLNNEQIISFTLFKTKVLLLIMMLKDAVEKLDFENLAFVVNSGVFHFKITRQNENIAFNNIWLRNSELELIRYLINSIIFDFKIQQRFADYQVMNRQVMIFRNTAKNKFVIIVKKFDNEEFVVRCSINTIICTALYLLTPEVLSCKGEVSNEF